MAENDLPLLNIYEVQVEGGTRSLVGFLDPVLAGARGLDSRAIDRLRFESRKKRSHRGKAEPLTEAAADPHDVLELREQGEVLRAALASLTPGERQAIETTFFAGLTHAEAAARLKQPLGTIKTRIRSGLHKLRYALTVEAGKP